MIENYVEELAIEIPEHLRQYIVTSIKGESKSVLDITYPGHATGFPFLASVYKDTWTLHTKGKPSHLIFQLNIIGQVDTEMNVELKGQFGQIGLVLVPTATYYLFHRPGTCFTSTIQDFEKVSPLKFQHLIADLSACKKPEQRIPILFDIIECLAKDRLPTIDWLDASLDYIFEADGNISQSELAERSGVSTRHFRRKFKEIIGVPPKYYCKVIQMNTFFELLKKSDTEALHAMAIDCGYYDQAHFINDFTQMIGSSPTKFLNGEHAFVQGFLGRKT